ncbi:MAG: four helix bundle protein [Parcubacteria group bacterium]|nr:four helix bundle protein [Parcubacteria group bacterium]
MLSPTLSFQLSTLSLFMEEFRFTKFKVYISAKQFTKSIFKVTANIKGYGDLANQINRASLSVVLNIAEGTGKKSDRDFNRYIQNALGSVHEIYAALDLAKDLNLVDEIKFNELVNSLTDIRKQLGGLSKKLSADS